MLALERPVLSLTIGALVDMNGEDALCGLLTLFLKCKDGLQDGDRLENMAKRLWHVERTSSRWCCPASSALSSPDLVVSSFSSSSEHETDVSSEGETWNQDQATAVHEATGASNNEASSTLSMCLSPDPPAQPDRSERQSLRRGKSNRRSPSPVSISSRKTSPNRRPSLARRRTHSNTSIGQIMADLLPDKLDLHRSASMNALLEQSTGHAESPILSTAEDCTPKVVVIPDVPLQQPQARPSPPPISGSFVRFPTVVIVNPTPHPTPPMTPQVSSPPTSPPTGPDANLAPRCDTLTVMPHAASPGSPTLPPTPESMTARGPMEESTVIPLPGSKHSSRSQSLDSDSNSVNIKAVEPGETTGKSAGANSTSNLHKLGSSVAKRDPVPSGSSLNPPEKKCFFSQVRSPDGDSPDTSASSQLGSQSGLIASVVSRPVVDKRVDETAGVGEPASVASRSSAFTHSSNGSSSRGNGVRMKREKGSTAPSAMKGKGKAKQVRPGVYRTQSNTKVPRVPTGPGTLTGGTFHRTRVGGRAGAASSGYHAALVPSQFAGQQTVRSGSNSGASVHPPPPAAVSKLVQEETSIKPSSSNPRPGNTTRRSSSRRSSKSSGSGKGAKANDQALPSSSAKQRRLEFADDSDYSTDTEWDTDASEEADGMGGENEQALADRKLAEAAAEAQRQRDLFAKVDQRSYQDLARVRTQPGLLSAIFHPDPNLFPPDHPYRHSRSTQDILAPVNRPSYAPLQPSRATAAAPVAAPVTAQGVGSPTLSNARQRSPLRLKGRPQDVEESESGEEDENNKLHVSESVAEKRLAMLHQNVRGGRPHAPSRQPQQEPGPREGRQLANAPTTATQAPFGFYGAPGAGPSLTRVATEPIPLGYPYNLPPPMPPSTPRTTRRNMLTHELSESLRRNLLWERQVSKQRPIGLGRRAVTNAPAPIAGPSRLRTSVTAAPNLNGQRADLQGNNPTNSGQAAKEKELREKRIRSWAGDFHATGW